MLLVGAILVVIISLLMAATSVLYAGKPREAYDNRVALFSAMIYLAQAGIVLALIRAAGL